MSLQFRPLPPLPQEQERPNEGLQILGGLQSAAQSYMTLKQQRAQLDLQKQQRDIELAKAAGEGGQEFWNSYQAFRAGRNPYGTGIPAAPGAAAAPAPAAAPVAPGPNQTPADPYAQYASVQDPFSPLPGMSPAAGPQQAPNMSMAPQAAAPAPAAAPTDGGLAAPQSALDITPQHLAQIRQQKGSKGLKEYMDQQNFMTGQQKDQATMSNLNIDNESKLRGDYSKAAGNFKVVSEQVQTIQSIANRPPTAAGDLSLIFSYMKLVDPGSTVREGEQASAANAAGVPDRLRALYNRAMTGERLAPAQRADFIKTSGDLYQGWLDKQKTMDDSFRGIATRSHVNPENVILPYGVANFDRQALARSPGATAMNGGGAAPPPAGGGGDMVRVTSPDGKVGSIPRANLAKAMQRGYKAAQ